MNFKQNTKWIQLAQIRGEITWKMWLFTPRGWNALNDGGESVQAADDGEKCAPKLE